jgi:ribosomal protein S18 acetylase RimI-like enzyme
MVIRHVEQADRDQWDRLYCGYADYYQVETDMPRRDRLFAWLLDPGHVCCGLVAETDTGLIGLAHYRSMPSPLRGAEVGFLDDLFVDPEQRGSGAAEALLRSVDDIAAERGWPVVRWITRDTNYRARGLYDRLSHRSDWITYEMTAASIGRG